METVGRVRGCSLVTTPANHWGLAPWPMTCHDTWALRHLQVAGTSARRLLLHGLLVLSGTRCLKSLQESSEEPAEHSRT